MTETLIGAYPDVFAAGSAWAGVPFGCFAGDGYDVWSDACATGQVTHTAAEWAALVAAAFPGYGDGWRPKLQIFHGTVDQVLNYTNYGEAVKEWTAVLGLDETPTSVTADVPKTGWTKSVYGNDWFEATSAANVTHDIGTNETVVLDWFDLTCTTGDCFKWGTGSPLR
jgi:acetylxylan esterase